MHKYKIKHKIFIQNFARLCVGLEGIAMLLFGYGVGIVRVLCGDCESIVWVLFGYCEDIVWVLCGLLTDIIKAV